MTDRHDLSPEQMLSIKDCNDLTDTFLELTTGKNVGVVLGACMNVIREAAKHLPQAERTMLADRLSTKFADDLRAMVDGEQPEPGSGLEEGKLGVGRKVEGLDGMTEKDFNDRINILRAKFHGCVPVGEHPLVTQAAALFVIHTTIATQQDDSGRAALLEAAEQTITMYRQQYNLPRPVRH